MFTRTDRGQRPMDRRLAPGRSAHAAAVVALLVALAAPAAGQQTARPMRFAHLAMEQGLSQSSVLCSFQDSVGFVWFGTEDGLNRFDGNGVTVYKHDPGDPRSLPNDFVWAIAEDARGDLWVGTEGGGLARWERKSERFLSYRHDPKDPNSLPGDRVRSVLVDRQGLVWVGTKGEGLARLDPASGRFKRFRHEPGNPGSLSHDGVYALHQDRSGTLWVGTDGGLNRFDASTEAFRRYVQVPSDPTSLSDNGVRALADDDQGSLWIGTFAGGLNELRPGSERFLRYRHDARLAASLADDCVHAVRQDRAGRLWVGSRLGLSLLVRDGQFVHYRHDPANPSSLADDEVMSLLEDRGGVLWVGTRAGGASRWNPATWSFGHVAAGPQGSAGLSNGYVTSFTEDGAGRLWVGTLGGGLDVFDRATGQVQHYRRNTSRAGSLSDDRVMALLRDREGTVWVGTMDGGLNRFQPATDTFKVYRADAARPGSLSANAIMSLFEDAAGTLWVGTYRGGLNRYDRRSDSFTAQRSVPGDPRSLSSDIVTSLAEGPGGVLWVGTEAGGLNRLDRRTGALQSFRHDPLRASSLGDDTVYSLHVDAAGTLWVGTRAGLARLEKPGVEPGTEAFRNYGVRDGLPSKVVYGIRPDGVGRLWLSTNNGLARFDPRTESFKDYSRSHGLQGNEFNFGAHYRAPRGELFFGGPNGFNAFTAESIPTNEHVPPVALTAFLKFNRPAADAGPAPAIDRIRLDYQDDVVTFEFAALDFAAPERNRYAYKLEGFDSDWIELGAVHRVTYTDLPHGPYVLRVKAANNDGLWNEQGLAVPVRVLPPPWRTWWAYLAYLLAGSGALVGLVRTQQRKLARETEYRRRLEVEVQARTQELARQNEQLEQLNTQLVETSLTDSLTGLRNRRFLFEEVGKEMSVVQRQHRERTEGLRDSVDQLVFTMVDLDWFKPINDTCGHAAGDRVLLQVRDVLEQACRSSDVVIRWGGDEFLVVGRVGDLDGVEVVAERVRAMIENTTFDLGDGQVAHITCSIGFTCYPASTPTLLGLSLEQVVSLADRALYAAKKAGRNAWVGLLGVPGASLEQVLRSLQDEPDSLLQSGDFAVRRSGGQGLAA